jgi:hypothetical protein
MGCAPSREVIDFWPTGASNPNSYEVWVEQDGPHRWRIRERGEQIIRSIDARGVRQTQSWKAFRTGAGPIVVVDLGEKPSLGGVRVSAREGVFEYWSKNGGRSIIVPDHGESARIAILDPAGLQIFPEWPPLR